MSDEMGSFLRFENITRKFGSFTAVNEVSLEIGQGETFSLLGPSGCGKTTLLRMAAGFDRPDSGRIFLDGKDITLLPPELRPVNTVFQNYALFPHLSIRDNIAFGPKMAKHDRASIQRDVDAMLELVDLKSHANQKPSQLSGGQKQRVAIARALVNKPKVLLLDEPLAALDLKLRQRLLVELDAIHDEVGITFIYVTHDQGEAMSISDRIAVMNKGVIEQIGPPAEIYETPRSSFVAAFIGDTNFLDGRITEVIDRQFSRCEVCGFGTITIENDKPVAVGDLIHLSLRPEKLNVLREMPNPAISQNIVRGEVEDVIYYGSHTRYWIRCGEWKLCAEMQHRNFQLNESRPKWGDEVWLSWQASDGYLLDQYRAEDEELLTLPDEDA
ncbi:ABC transporter ATP-binding protein [Luteolibacter pohnpeiensis]|uniref:Spermidine/putrescine import ATP-binding protein PotA n=1 Tax=Luteolibacter pohnpeiensis TaxID=454153 RepID=A0A934VVZ4_9BACT|nr:ABC transporter ATP-binding protein [Luteolibacter pohnpeiensis]MBK1882740.1 ABC transporter ATP-binding protein [Luteolibacter pohnpeiensis]